MKRIRYILIVLMSAFFINAEAGDTLTRAQVYNFNVGDTFDYRNYSFNRQTYDTPYNNIQITYTRYVISNIYWSADTQTKYIVRNQLYPALAIDTLILSDLQGYEVIMDSLEYFFSLDAQRRDTFIISGTQSYFGRETNFADYNCCSPWSGNILLGRGLGKVLVQGYGGALSYTWLDSIVLIYYSGDSGTYGTPYTSFPNNISNIPASENISLYPSPNDGTFTIETGNETRLPFEFSIYDLAGRKSMELMISDKTNVIHADGLSNGIYIWNVSAVGNSLQKGKIVIER